MGERVTFRDRDSRDDWRRVKFLKGEITLGTPSAGMVRCGPRSDYAVEVTIKQLAEILYGVRDSKVTGGGFSYNYTRPGFAVSETIAFRGTPTAQLATRRNYESYDQIQTFITGPDGPYLTGASAFFDEMRSSNCLRHFGDSTTKGTAFATDEGGKFGELYNIDPSGSAQARDPLNELALWKKCPDGTFYTNAFSLAAAPYNKYLPLGISHYLRGYHRGSTTDIHNSAYGFYGHGHLAVSYSTHPTWNFELDYYSGALALFDGNRSVAYVGDNLWGESTRYFINFKAWLTVTDVLGFNHDVFTSFPDGPPYSNITGASLKILLSSSTVSCPIYSEPSSSGGSPTGVSDITIQATKWWPWKTKGGDPAWDAATGLPINGGPGA